MRNDITPVAVLNSRILMSFCVVRVRAVTRRFSSPSSDTARADLARLDRKQNVRVALKQMIDKQSVANSSKMRFFLVDRSTPALEPEPGSMLLLGSDGTWSDISPSEVLADEGSPEVSEEIFVSVVARLGGSMPGAS